LLQGCKSNTSSSENIIKPQTLFLDHNVNPRVFIFLNLLELLPFRHIQELCTFASSKGKANAAQDEIMRIWGGNQDLTSEK
jgi:hypothetical protein